jgi:hypothetical protein
LSLKSVGLAALCLLWAAPALAQVAILQIRVIEGEGAVHLPASRSSRAITVEITEETGKPVAGAAVSFHLPEDGPGGTFVNGLRTEVVLTDSSGHASLHGLQANRVPGRFPDSDIGFQGAGEGRHGFLPIYCGAEGRDGGGIEVGIDLGCGGPEEVGRSCGGGGWGCGGWFGGYARGAAPPAVVVPSAPAPPVLSIGTPAITVGRP